MGALLTSVLNWEAEATAVGPVVKIEFLASKVLSISNWRGGLLITWLYDGVEMVDIG